MRDSQPGRPPDAARPLEFVRTRRSPAAGAAATTTRTCADEHDRLPRRHRHLPAVVVQRVGRDDPRQGVKLPKAENVDDMIDAPMVAVNGSQILVDGVQAGDTRAIEELDACSRSTSSSTAQEQARALEAGRTPDKHFPGVCILQIDQDVPAVVVKSVFQTAAFAGFPNVSFMVGKLPSRTE